MIDRLPPHSIEAEQGLLGCVFLSPNNCMAECLAKLNEGAESFYDLRHQAIYETLAKMFSVKEAIDVITVQQRLKENSQLEAVGGIAYLASLPDVVPSAANLPHYLGIVLDKFVLRKILRTCTETAARIYDQEGEVQKIVEEFEKEALSVRRVTDEGEEAGAKELVHTVINEFEEMHARGGGMVGLASGFPDLDKMTKGFRKKDMIVIAARPSTGKSSLAMNIADHVSVELKEPVGVFSFEMSKESLMMRQVCARARCNLNELMEGNFHDRDFPKITIAAGKLNSSPLIINDKGGMTILQLRAKARRMQQKHGIKLFVIDYLQKVRGHSKKAEVSRQNEIAEVSAGIKETAMELDVPVIVLAQLNRDMEKRKSNIPMMSDLRESGAIEQDADFIGLLYSPRDDDSDSTDTSSAPVDLLIAKQRNGPTGTVHLTFLKQFTRFESAAKIRPEDLK
jgi:replicative DNA helicase